jgi:hypothetical protein
MNGCLSILFLAVHFGYIGQYSCFCARVSVGFSFSIQTSSSFTGAKIHRELAANLEELGNKMPLARHTEKKLVKYLTKETLKEWFLERSLNI